MDWFVLKLDTTAPAITWGPVDGAVASETMTVLYTLDEPQAVEATLKLTDNRALQCLVSSDRITVEIPGDAPEGLATLTAKLVDSVGNETLATLDIAISGVLPPEQPTYPSLPSPPVEAPWRTRSRCVTRSRYRVLSTSRLPSRATIRSRTRVARRPAPSSPSWVLVRSSDRVRAHVGQSARLQSADRWTITKRPEGPDAEAEIVLLLL